MEAKAMKILTIRILAKLNGNLEAALPWIQYGRLYMWYLHQSKNKALKKTKGNYDGMCIF